MKSLAIVYITMTKTWICHNRDNDLRCHSKCDRQSALWLHQNSPYFIFTVRSFIWE